MCVERETNSTGEIEITPEMIEAAAEVLWHRRTLDITESLAEGLAREMLTCALSVFRGRS